MVRHKNRWLLVKIELAEDIRTSKSKSKSNPTSSSRRNGNGNGNRNSNSNRNSNGDDKNSSFPSRNEFATRLRRTMAYCYGIASGEGPSVNVRFCDATTQLALVRVPRDDCDIVRSSLTLLLTKKQLKSVRYNSGNNNSNSGNGNGDNNDETTTMSDYCASVRSVHGSARTARIAAMRALREWYRAEIRNSRNETETENENDQTTDDENNNEQLQQQQQQRKSETRLCRGLQERLIQIQNCVN